MIYLLCKCDICLRYMKERILFHILPQGKIHHDPQGEYHIAAAIYHLSLILSNIEAYA